MTAFNGKFITFTMILSAYLVKIKDLMKDEPHFGERGSERIRVKKLQSYSDDFCDKIK